MLRFDRLAGTALVSGLLLLFQGCVAGIDVEAGENGGSGGSANECTGENAFTKACTQDESCDSSTASTGTACDTHCVTTCGFAALGTKRCTCEAGYYSACPCDPPPDYQGAATAPMCDDTEHFELAWAGGKTDTVKGNPCNKEWAQCIGTDVPTGTTPRGCVCMKNPVNANLQWYCGSTNKWFALGYYP